MVDVQPNQPSENIAETAPGQGRARPEEFQKLVQELSVRDRPMVLLIGSTGLRRSEMIALTWSDLNIRTMEVNVLRSSVRNRIGKTKTESSCRPVPLHPLVLNALLEWRGRSPYSTDLDFLFPSVRFKGNKPLSPDSILEKSVRPALARIGVVGKRIGWTASAIHSRLI
jgi:integrase